MAALVALSLLATALAQSAKPYFNLAYTVDTTASPQTTISSSFGTEYTQVLPSATFSGGLVTGSLTAPALQYGSVLSTGAATFQTDYFGTAAGSPFRIAEKGLKLSNGTVITNQVWSTDSVSAIGGLENDYFLCKSINNSNHLACFSATPSPPLVPVSLPAGVVAPVLTYAYSFQVSAGPSGVESTPAGLELHAVYNNGTDSGPAIKTTIERAIAYAPLSSTFTVRVALRTYGTVSDGDAFELLEEGLSFNGGKTTVTRQSWTLPTSNPSSNLVSEWITCQCSVGSTEVTGDCYSVS